MTSHNFSTGEVMSLASKRDEKWWLSTAGFVGMQTWLGKRLRGRKRVLFGCATARMVWDFVKRKVNRQAIVLSEAYADGLVDRAQMARVWQRLRWESAMYSEWNIVALTDDLEYVGPTQEQRDRFDADPRSARFYQPARKWADALRDLFGNPFRPVTIDPLWLAHEDGFAVKLATAIYEEHRFADLPILADVLEEAGCSSAPLIEHLRSPGPHYRGCWALDLVLSRTGCEHLVNPCNESARPRSPA